MNEPVAWMGLNQLNNTYSAFTENDKERMLPHVQQLYANWIPLYTHQAKELNAGGEPVKNATYWKRQYNEMSALNDRLKSSLYHANEQIKYLELHPAKTLTDEEMYELLEKYQGIELCKAVLRKAQEK